MKYGKLHSYFKRFRFLIACKYLVDTKYKVLKSKMNSFYENYLLKISKKDTIGCFWKVLKLLNVLIKNLARSDIFLWIVFISTKYNNSKNINIIYLSLFSINLNFIFVASLFARVLFWLGLNFLLFFFSI